MPLPLSAAPVCNTPRRGRFVAASFVPIGLLPVVSHRDVHHGRRFSTRVFFCADDVDGPAVEQQETEMNTQNQENNLLSDDELDAVAGGVKNCETMAFAAFLMGAVSTCGQAGYTLLANSFAAAQGH
jgi:hypothetical protein